VVAVVCGGCSEIQSYTQPPQEVEIDMALLIECESGFIQGLEFILIHFKEPLFPRTISTKTTQGRQLAVNSREEALARFEQANELDCRIAAYPVYSQSYIKGTGISPDFLFIDLDSGQFDGSKSRLDRCLNKTLANIRTKFNDSSLQPTVIWSGNGYHIYLPVEGFVLESQDVFAEYISSNECSRKFMQFAERFLSDDKADLCHWKGVSFKNCMLRVPGSINSKNNAQVQIIQRWNGIRPAINWLLRDYRRYLIQEIYIEPTLRKPRSAAANYWVNYWRKDK
jgi:hypothetical protein